MTKIRAQLAFFNINDPRLFETGLEGESDLEYVLNVATLGMIKTI